MKENSRTGNELPETGETTLATNAKLVAAAWRRIDRHTKQDWNELAQRQREDADCGLLTTSTSKCDKCHKVFSQLADKRYTIKGIVANQNVCRVVQYSVPNLS
ncbi:Hypothetical predicted protein [Paramuricea clavata]|uniref:Uncharacterized protein n=1 Tax=Paramuricea clavata TaxID=317549 RepID=A0A6S7GQL5_PARCT|nr:Hypothetical predicted protein [Paramuricea clavata]